MRQPRRVWRAPLRARIQRPAAPGSRPARGSWSKQRGQPLPTCGWHRRAARTGNRCRFSRGSASRDVAGRSQARLACSATPVADRGCRCFRQYRSRCSDRERATTAEDSSAGIETRRGRRQRLRNVVRALGGPNGIRRVHASPMDRNTRPRVSGPALLPRARATDQKPRVQPVAVRAAPGFI